MIGNAKAETIVVDASVAVKLTIDEPGSVEARSALLERAALVAPILMRHEALNVLSRKARLGEIDDVDVHIAFNLLTMGGIEFLDTDERTDLYALLMSINLNHPIGDCLYLALARSLEAVLLTADRQFADKVRRDARLAPYIQVLGEA